MMIAGTLDAVGLYEQISEWDGVPPAYLFRLPLHEVANHVMDFLSAVPLDELPWVSINLLALQNIAKLDALQFAAHLDAVAYRKIMGDWPW